MNKKGVIWETLADVILAGLILFIGISLFFYISGRETAKKQEYFNSKITYLNNDHLILSLASYDVNAFNEGNEDKLKTNIDTALEKLYKSKMCWTLYQDGETLVKEGSCRKKENIMNSSIFIPTKNHNVTQLMLVVNGYVK